MAFLLLLFDDFFLEMPYAELKQYMGKKEKITTFTDIFLRILDRFFSPHVDRLLVRSSIQNQSTKVARRRPAEPATRRFKHAPPTFPEQEVTLRC